MPNEFTPTSSDRSSGHGRGSVGTVSLHFSNGTLQPPVSHDRARVYQDGLLLGFGVVKLMFGGIIFFSRANVILMILDSPEAPSPWPIFGLTYGELVRTRAVSQWIAHYRSNIYSIITKDISNCRCFYRVSDLYSISQRHRTLFSSFLPLSLRTAVPVPWHSIIAVLEKSLIPANSCPRLIKAS